MGEYATRKIDGERVKIGTCEDMYYLRADQAGQVYASDEGETDPREFARELRFRFPFPDEDQVRPGEFSDPFRYLSIDVDPADVPAFEHGTVQFTANYPKAGYVMSIPCPEGADALPGVTIHKNGWRGSTLIVQQRVWGGALVLVAACGGCDAKYRLETLDMAEPYILAARQRADRLARLANVDPRKPRDMTPEQWDGQITYWHTVADRIAGGYTKPPAWVGELVPA